MKLSGITHIIFDLDGTLLDTFDDICLSVNYALEHTGFQRKSHEAIRAKIGHGAVHIIEAVTHCDDEERVAHTLRLFRRHYLEHPITHTRPYPGVSHTLDILHSRNMLMSVISNKPHNIVMAIIERLHMNSYFNAIIGGQNGYALKPDPSMPRAVMKAAVSTPQESLIVGDQDTDVNAARNAETHFIGVTYGFSSREQMVSSGAELLIDFFPQLLDYLDPSE